MLVSLCVIAYNEEKVLNGLFRNIAAQTYPHQDIEVILVDSESTDKTRSMMEDFKATDYKFNRVEIVTNSKKNQASAWNCALCAAKGDVIIRIDAHASIPRDFIRRCADNLEEGEDIVGGGRPNIVDNETSWKLTLLAAEESLFGSSIAEYRRPTEKKEYHDSLFHAAYRRKVFEKVGGFNESLGRTEDNELHYRIREAGFKMCSCPDIISFQHTRNTFKHMIKQKFGNGYWIGLTTGVCRGCLSYFHFVPFAFLLVLILFSVLACFGYFYPIMFLTLAYAMFDFTNTVGCFVTKKVKPQFFVLPLLFPVLHIAYGVGTLWGLIKMPFWKHKLGDKPYKRIEEVRQIMIKNNPENSQDT
ncbi:MAG: glycosyltransferase family 2 protein [Clostridia bacterium]|nr:glycosyltransferase family 2 protein [Clostridia bacterium]